uniref:Uncharacterized protein n=1 Tax=Oryza barthii TaxID=65489 RepID=A0A0D3F4Z5_9ORYZ
MAELALGLETSGRPFLWAVQPLVGFDHKDGFDPGWLPGTSGGWVGADPGALVHGRVLESIRHGVPLLGWPVGAEQFFNAMVVVESGEEETVMREKEKGEAMRRKAEEIADAMAAAWEGPGGSSAARLEQFLRCVEASALRASPPPPSKP